MNQEIRRECCEVQEKNIMLGCSEITLSLMYCYLKLTWILCKKSLHMNDRAALQKAVENAVRPAVEKAASCHRPQLGDASLGGKSD